MDGLPGLLLPAAARSAAFLFQAFKSAVCSAQASLKSALLRYKLLTMFERS